MPTLKKIENDYVYFSNGKMNRFNAIIFAIGYKSTILKWIKVEFHLNVCVYIYIYIFIYLFIYRSHKP